MLALSLVPSLAWGGDVPLVDWAKGRVEEGLVKPLREQDSNRSRFSRARPPARQMRVQVVQVSATLDKRGKGFVPFAIEVFYGDQRGTDIVGCIYQGSGDMFVKSGDAYRPAAFLLGKNLEPVAGVCEAAPKRS